MRVLRASRLRYPQSSILSLVIVLPTDYIYCPNLIMFSKLSTSIVKSKDNIMLIRIKLLKVKCHVKCQCN